MPGVPVLDVLGVSVLGGTVSGVAVPGEAAGRAGGTVSAAGSSVAMCAYLIGRGRPTRGLAAAGLSVLLP
jgi:hypothetical protein